MKTKTIYQIHALIGRCYLHTRKKSTYSITLKMGSKAVASTDFKIPVNDQINFNTELILKIDKNLYEGPGKLSIIVTMLSQQKQKIIIGSVFANFKAKGPQSHKISFCSSKDKGFQVNVEFEVVNIQNLNYNLNNNKIQSPNHSQMKDLKKTLTVSRQKQLVKSSLVKISNTKMSPTQKNQPRTSRQKIQKQFKQQMFPNMSSLTTKIAPNSVKINQQSKKYLNQFKDKIIELQIRVKDLQIDQKSYLKQISSLRGEFKILKDQNQCLIQILSFEEQKSSAAMSYIQYLSQKISQKQLISCELNQYLKIIKDIQANDLTNASQTIMQHKTQYKSFNDSSFKFRCLQQAIPQQQQIDQETNEKLIKELRIYKISIEELRQKITDLESQQFEKNQSINYLEIQITKINKQNNFLREQIQKLSQVSISKQLQFLSFNVLNKEFNGKIKGLQKQIQELNAKNHQMHQQNNKIERQNNNSSKEAEQSKQKNIELQAKLFKLKQLQERYDCFARQHEHIKNQQYKLKTQQPKTPLYSEITPPKLRYDQGRDTKQIQNIIDQLNEYIDKKSPMISLRKVHNNQNFLSRNQSLSLLKDSEVDPDSPDTHETTEKTCEITYRNEKPAKKVQIPEHEKQMQRYSYEYDIDSLNYFNNFQQNHQGIFESITQDNNCCGIEVEYNT